MVGAIVVILLVLVVLAVVLVAANRRRRRLADAKAEARRWVERLGGQVMNLTGTDMASQQAIADAAERYTSAGSQMEQATSVPQCQLVTKTALEGLYYVRAARLAMDLDPGPALPVDPNQGAAGKVTEARRVTMQGHDYEASPNPGNTTPHYYPGGRVAGRPVPQGWYSEPWWKPALVAGAWGLGSVLLFDMMFSGMVGIPDAANWEQGYDAMQEPPADPAGDAGLGQDGDVGGPPDLGSGDIGGDFGDFSGF